MTSKHGRPSGRPRSFASFLRDPGASPERGETVFPSSPRSPLLHGVLERWPIDADAPWKSCGWLRSTARTQPSTAFSTELGKPANGCRFPTSVNRPAALRSVLSALSLSSKRAYSSSTINPSTKSGQLHTLGDHDVVFAGKPIVLRRDREAVRHLVAEEGELHEPPLKVAQAL